MGGLQNYCQPSVFTRSGMISNDCSPLVNIMIATGRALYKKIQSIRENGMDMTGWLEYFITGLQTQMIEVKKRGEQVIKREVLTQKHSLNERQTKAIEYILRYDRLTIQNYEGLCPEVNRRSLQRDLKIMIEKELLGSEGATNQLVYFLRV
jgi:hypothetical protein